MPNQRAKGQKLINFPAKEAFISLVDEALPKIGYGDRSSFIRDAIADKLEREGVTLPRELSAAPMRSGKRINSKSDVAAAKAARKAAESARKMTQ